MEKFTDQQDSVVEPADVVCISDMGHKENSRIRSQWIIFNGDIKNNKTISPFSAEFLDYNNNL